MAVDLTIVRFKHIIASILSKSTFSRVIIMGDFNDRRDECSRYLQSKGITPILDPNLPTHNLGG